jgi:fluoride exporter
MTNLAALRLLGAGFPWGTAIVNIAGSFAMGLLAVMLLEKVGNERLSPFLMTGILGGFTTFSAFSLDTVRLVENGQTTSAIYYIAGSVALSIAALMIGMGIARAWA